MSLNPKYNVWAMLTAAFVLELLIWLSIGLVLVWLVHVMPGLRFQHSHLVWLLAVGPVMLLVFALVLWLKNRRFDRFSDAALLGFLVTDVSSVKVVTKFMLWRLAAFFLVVALINPQMGSKMTETKVQGIEIMLAVDVSNSMLAEDLKPNRITLARRAIERFVDKLRGDRLGIVIFAGEAFVQLPLTNDYGAAKLFLNSVRPDMVPTQGTAIGAAIERSLQSFDFGSPGQKTIIIISDGENHEDDAVGAANTALEQGVRVFTIGVGSVKGSPIPEFQGNRRLGFRKDRDGQTIMTRLNEDMLREIAEAGGGSYIRASMAEVGLNTLLDELNEMEKSDLGSVSYAEYEDRFQIFLALALVCLLIELMLTERRGRLAQKLNIFEQS